MSWRDFKSSYKAFHIVVCGIHYDWFLFGSSLFKERVPKVLGTLKKYLVLTIDYGVLGNLVKGHNVFFVKVLEIVYVESCMWISSMSDITMCVGQAK